MVVAINQDNNPTSSVESTRGYKIAILTSPIKAPKYENIDPIMVCLRMIPNLFFFSVKYDKSKVIKLKVKYLSKVLTSVKVQFWGCLLQSVRFCVTVE